MNLETMTLTNMYYTINSRDTGEKVYNTFIETIFKEHYYDLKQIYYSDTELREKLNWEIDEVLALESGKQKCELNYEELSEAKIISLFVTWKKITRSYNQNKLYSAELNNNGKKLIKRWNKYLINYFNKN